MTLEGTFNAAAEVLKHTPAADVTGGQVIQLANGLAAIADRDIDYDASETGSVRIEGEFRIRNVALAANVGDNVWWDENGTAVDTATGACTPSAAAGDFWIGTLTRALAATDTVAYVALNKQNVNLPVWPNKIHTLKTDDYTVATTDGGTVLHIATDAKTFTLPSVAATPGLEIIIQNDGANGNNIITIDTNAVDKFESPVQLDDGDKYVNTKTTAIRGDYVRLIGTLTGWFVAEQRGTWADGGA